MKFLSYLLVGAVFCFSLTSTGRTPLRGYDRVTSKDEIENINPLITKGVSAALQLAAADEVIGEDCADRYQLDNVKYVSKQYRDADEVTSYFIEGSLKDLADDNVQAEIGYIIDRSDRNGRLNLRAYKIEFAD